MKKLIPVICLCLLFCGCTSYEEIEDAIMVSGMAVDMGETDNYKVTVEIVDLSTGEGEPPGAQLISSEGPTVFSALENINTATSKKLFFSQTRVIAISEQVAKEGLINIIDVIVRDNELRITNDVVVAKDCAAADLFTLTDSGNPVRSYEIADLLENESKTLSVVPRVQVFELINIVGSSGVAAVLPAFSYIESVEKKSLTVSGTAVFKDDRLVDFLDINRSKIMTLLQGEAGQGLISEPIRTDTQEYMTVKIFDSKVKVRHKETDGEITMHIDIDMEVGINELTARENIMNKKGRSELMKKLETRIKENTEELVRYLQQGSGADALGFGERIYKQNPDLWEKIRKTDYFKNLKIKTQVKVNLLGTGFIAKSPSASDFRFGVTEVIRTAP